MAKSPTTIVPSAIIELTTLSASIVVVLPVLLISPVKFALVTTVVVLPDDVTIPAKSALVLLAVSTYTLVAASWALVGSATPVSFFAPRATSALAAPNPLNGMFALSSFALVTLASNILTVVTLASAIFDVVIFKSLIFAVSTALLAKSPTTIVPSAIIELTTTPCSIVDSPKLSIVTSPFIVTSVATLLPFPK